MNPETCIFNDIDTFDASFCPICCFQADCDAYRQFELSLALEPVDDEVADIWLGVQAEYAIMV